MTLVVLTSMVYYLVENKYNPKICFSRVPNDPAHKSLVAFMEKKSQRASIWTFIMLLLWSLFWLLSVSILIIKLSRGLTSLHR